MTFNVQPAQFQNSTALTQMSCGVLHHLRVGHPAIDAVYKVKENGGDTYLLLIQVSLCTYGEHKAKAITIHKSVTGNEKERAGVGVSNYLRMTGCENMVYIYASPASLVPPGEDTFAQEVRSHGTRSGSGVSRRCCWYGFVLQIYFKVSL